MIPGLLIWTAIYFASWYCPPCMGGRSPTKLGGLRTVTSDTANTLVTTRRLLAKQQSQQVWHQLLFLLRAFSAAHVTARAAVHAGRWARAMARRVVTSCTRPAK